uniref:Staphylococcal nuclease domain-containing protein n=1 Tax=Rhabditophanes sp. KR3021 TaxID=114890 RepID=A0AC35TVF8_9BILA
MSDQTAKTKIAYVKQVLSGDSIVLFGDNTDIHVCLSYVKAPRLAKPANDKNEALIEEPFAWESREFMRKRIVGSRVFFVRDYTGSNGREFGQIYFGSESLENCQNISELALQAGLLEFKEGKHGDQVTHNFIHSQEQALNHKLGKWGPIHLTRNASYTLDNPTQFVNQHKSKPLRAIIENVRDGSTFQAYIPSQTTYINFVLSGIRCPSFLKNEPFAKEAKSFVEARLLNREIDLLVEATENNKIVASISHRAGNIAILMLQLGYAKCADWSLPFVTGGYLPFREAQNKAKQERKGVWQDWTESNAVKHTHASGKVIEIGLVDNITVLTDAGDEVKYYLASVRAPRADPSTNNKQFKPLYDIPCMLKGREFLRTKLIGKRVTVIVDYIQPQSEQYPEKIGATILFNNENIGESLVKKGLAKVVRHKRDDENKSSQYDLLMMAEKEAELAKINIWCEKRVEKSRVSEIQNDLSRAKHFLATFTRASKLTGVVEFVSSGSRVRIFIPKENVVIALSLSGIVSPRVDTNNDGEAFSKKALKLVKNLIYQQDVRLEVESVDKHGGFIGHIFVQEINISKYLLENGLATVHSTAAKTRFATEFYEAEKSAKSKNLNLWNNYVEETVTEEEKENHKENFKRVVVSHIDPSSLSIWIQSYEMEDQLCDLIEKVQIVGKSSQQGILPKRRELCLGKSTYDGLWNRVRIEGIKDDIASVYLVDYGNSEQVPYKADNFKMLPNENKALPFAKEIQLAFTAIPEHYKELVLEKMMSILYKEEFIYALHEYKNGNVDHTTLAVHTKDGKKYNVGKSLVNDGFLMAQQKCEPRFKSTVDEYQRVENEARMGRHNIWRYGDFTGNEL